MDDVSGPAGPQGPACRALSEHTEAAKAILRAISNESRMMILCCMAGGEMSVGQIIARTALRQPVVSQQLAFLREQKMVDSRRDGKEVHYTLTSVPIRVVLESLDEVFTQRNPPRA